MVSEDSFQPQIEREYQGDDRESEFLTGKESSCRVLKGCFVERLLF